MTDLKLIPPLTKILAFSVAINGFLILGHYLSISRYGTSLFLDVLIPVLLSFLLSIPLALLSLPAMFFRKFRKIAITVLLGSLLHMGITYVGMNRANEIRHNGLFRLTERSRPLISAIKAFETKYGRPPAVLEDLVPEFIAAVPSTGIGAYSEYRYSTDPGTILHRKSKWILKVPTSFGVMKWDEMIYLPGQDYARSGYGGMLKLINDWAYLNE